MPSLSLSTKFSLPQSASIREQTPAPYKAPISLEQAGPSTHSLSITNRRMTGTFKEAEYSDEGGNSESKSSMILGSAPPKRRFSFRRSHTVKATSGSLSTIAPESGSRSLLSRRRNSVLSKAILNIPPPRVVSAPVISQSQGSPRRSSQSIPVDDDRELDMLREAAARSIGISSTEGDSLSNRVSFGDSSDKAGAVRQRNGAVRFQEPGVSGVRSESPSMDCEPILPFPCLLSSLKPHIRYTSAVSKYYAPPSFVTFLGPNKGSTRHWKSRHLVLTSATSAVTSSTTGGQVYVRTDYLHLFKGSFPDDKEVDRLLLTDSAAVMLPSERDHLGARQCVVKVNGHNAKSIKQDERGTLILQGETIWLFQCPDSQTMQKWLVSIRDAILNYRYWRAGPTRRPGTPSGIMTVRSRIQRTLTPDILGSDCLTSDDESQTVPDFRAHTSLGIHTNASKPRGLRALFINTQHNQSSTLSSTQVANQYDWKTPVASRGVSPSRPEISSVSSSPNPPLPSTEGTCFSSTRSTPEVSQDLSLTSEDSVVFSPEGVPCTKPKTLTPLSTVENVANIAREGRTSSGVTPKDAASTVSKPGSPVSTTPLEVQMVSVAVPAHLLVGVPITPVEERPPDSSSLGRAKKSRLMDSRTFSPSTNAIQGEKERENFQRFLASPSYNPSILGSSLLRGMTQATSLSLPPPPRSRRATTSGGLLHSSTGSGRASPSLAQSRSRGSLDMSPATDASGLDIHRTPSKRKKDSEDKTSDLSAVSADFNMSPRSVRLSPPGIDDSSPRSWIGGSQLRLDGSDSNDASAPDILCHYLYDCGKEVRPRHSSSPSTRRSSSLPKMVPSPQGPTPEGLFPGDTVVYNPTNCSIPPWRQTQSKTGTCFTPSPVSIRTSSSHSVHSFQSHTTNISNEGSITPVSTSPTQSYPSPYAHPYATTSSHSFGIHERDNGSTSFLGAQANQCDENSSPSAGVVLRRLNHASSQPGSSTSHGSSPSFSFTVGSRRKSPPNLIPPSPPRSDLKDDEDFLDLSPTRPESPTGEMCPNFPPYLDQFSSHPFPSVRP